ncbi:MAG: hypothetical protein GXY07_14900 [Candidatus Hydrogenedentes bacterium]|nr:hypothetical protein [Candidatus Hydrogenedentota bacterium]
MKRVTLVALISLVTLALAWSVSVAAQDDAAKGISVQVTGKNVNLVKAVCGDEAQELDPALGAMNALVVTEAVDAEGKAVEGLAGKMLHYLPVASASKLISGEENAGKGVTVKGVLYKDAMVVAVKEFEVKAAEDAAAGGDDWDDWDELEVKTMSQQQVI